MRRTTKWVNALAGAVAVTAAMSVPATAAAVPYRDPAALGYLGICNAADQQVTSGSTLTVPFAWRVVSSQAAPAPYNDDWRTAILLAYQPQNGLEPGEWSGEELTASSRYSNPAHPMAAATTGDYSLADFIGDYPTRWDGLIQLRLYLGTQNAPVYSLHYPTLDLKVTGTTWRALDGGAVDCHAGTATSLESIVLHHTSTTTTTTTTTTTVSSASASSSRPSSTTWWWLGALGVVVIAGGVLVWRRRPHTSAVPLEPERHNQ